MRLMELFILVLRTIRLQIYEIICNIKRKIMEMFHYADLLMDK